MQEGGERESSVEFTQQAENFRREEGTPPTEQSPALLLKAPVGSAWESLGFRPGSVGGPAAPFLPVSQPSSAWGLEGALGHLPEELPPQGLRGSTVAPWEEPSSATRQLWG